ncbi:MAG: hypothetical protein IJ748_00290 [Bacteroidales bacterium]|nr:hypothetical protein [Bacteroidales bacterium]
MKKIFFVLALISLCAGLQAQENQKEEKKCVSDCCTAYKQSLHHFTLNIGYGFMLSDSHDTDVFEHYLRSDHARHMRHGINYEFDYDYNFHKNFSLGFVASMYNAFDSFYYEQDSEETFSDDRYVFYVGPSFLAHTNLVDNKWIFYGRATIGFANFRNATRTQVLAMNQLGVMAPTSTSFTYKRATLGYGLEIGSEYILSKYLSLNAQLSFMGGSISKVKEGDDKTELSENESLSRLGISAGVKIKL